MDKKLRECITYTDMIEYIEKLEKRIDELETKAKNAPTYPPGFPYIFAYPQPVAPTVKPPYIGSPHPIAYPFTVSGGTATTAADQWRYSNWNAYNNAQAPMSKGAKLEEEEHNIADALRQYLREKSV